MKGACAYFVIGLIKLCYGKSSKMFYHASSQQFNMNSRGARKLTGENLKLVWAEFSTSSSTVLMMSIYLFTWMHAHFYS